MGDIDRQLHCQGLAHRCHQTDLDKELDMEIGGMTQRVNSRGDVNRQDDDPRIVIVERKILALIDDLAVVFDIVLVPRARRRRVTAEA